MDQGWSSTYEARPALLCATVMPTFCGKIGLLVMPAAQPGSTLVQRRELDSEPSLPKLSCTNVIRSPGRRSVGLVATIAVSFLKRKKEKKK